MFKKTRNPFLFQGKLNKKNYFEGWYYKLVSRDKKHTLALIPGISLNNTDPHVFIQAFLTRHIKDKSDMNMHYFRFDVSNFDYNYDTKQLSIVKNLFGKKQLKLSLSAAKMNISGNLQLNHLRPIRTSLFSPSIMGFFGYFKFMECYHGVISMSHSIKGQLEINQETIDFTDGR